MILVNKYYGNGDSLRQKSYFNSAATFFTKWNNHCQIAFSTPFPFNFFCWTYDGNKRARILSGNLVNINFNLLQFCSRLSCNDAWKSLLRTNCCLLNKEHGKTFKVSFLSNITPLSMVLIHWCTNLNQSALYYWHYLTI